MDEQFFIHNSLTDNENFFIIKHTNKKGNNYKKIPFTEGLCNIHSRVYCMNI
jgi:hypothetical protein